MTDEAIREVANATWKRDGDVGPLEQRKDALWVAVVGAVQGGRYQYRGADLFLGVTRAQIRQVPRDSETTWIALICPTVVHPDLFDLEGFRAHVEASIFDGGPMPLYDTADIMQAYNVRYHRSRRDQRRKVAETLLRGFHAEQQ